MVNRSVSAIIVLVMVIIAAIVLSGTFFPNNNSSVINSNSVFNEPSNNTSTTANTSPIIPAFSPNTEPVLADQGRYIVTLQDAAVGLQGVSQIKVNIGSVRAYSVTEGWTTISSTAQTIDLIQLKNSGKNVLIADSNLLPDSYNQLGLLVYSVIVVDAQGAHFAALPTEFITLNTEANVNVNEITVTSIDILADKSIYTTNKGEYIFAPTIQFQTNENSVVKINSSNNLTLTRGTPKVNATVGMDEYGMIGEGFSISPNAILSIDETGELVVG